MRNYQGVYWQGSRFHPVVTIPGRDAPFGFQNEKASLMTTRVFVVEDSTNLRERLIGMLTEIQGIEVVGYAPDAVQANKLIEAAKPDVVILDIRLQQSTGYQVLKNLRSIKDPPITIVLTNYPYPQYRKRYMEAGADYFFDKSSEIDQVLSVLKNIVKSGVH